MDSKPKMNETPPELDAIQRMNLERKIAVGIFAVLLAAYGVVYFFLQTPHELIGFDTQQEMAGEGEGHNDVPVSSKVHHIGPPIL